MNYMTLKCRGGLIALLYTWIFCTLNGIDVSLHTLLHLLAYLGKVTQELWLELGHTKSISIDQNLSVTTVAGSDTDGYGFHLSCSFSRQFSWNLLKR